MGYQQPLSRKMHNVIRIMVMIAAVCLFFRLQKCSVDGKEHSDNSEEFFRYLKMRQRTTHDKSSQKPFQQYLEDQLFKSNHSSTISKFKFVEDKIQSVKQALLDCPWTEDSHQDVDSILQRYHKYFANIP